MSEFPVGISFFMISEVETESGTSIQHTEWQQTKQC